MLTWYIETLVKNVSYYPSEIDSWILASTGIRILMAGLILLTIGGVVSNLIYLIGSKTRINFVKRFSVVLIYILSGVIVFLTFGLSFGATNEVTELRIELNKMKNNLSDIILQDYVENESPSEGIVQLKEPLSITEIKDGGYILLNTFVEGVFYEDTLVYVVATDSYPPNTLVPFTMEKYTSMLGKEKDKYTFADDNQFLNNGMLDIENSTVYKKDGKLLVLDDESFNLSDIKYIYNVGELK